MILQVALDMMNLRRALAIAKDSVAGGVDWLEVGTPLIKSEGMDAVRALKRLFPERTIVADMKTMDTGRFETEMAAKSGADIVCVLGIADDETIKEAITAAHNYGAKVMVDLIAVADKATRAKAVEQLGADYICIHVGIDEQMRGGKDTDTRKVVKHVGIPVAVAGGLNSETVHLYIKDGADIIIVGSAITKAKDVKKSTEIIKKAMSEHRCIKSTLKRHTAEDIAQVFAQVSTSNISDAMHRRGAMKDIRPLKNGYKMVGRALTVKTLDGDWAKPVEAIEKANAGTVLVIDAGGGKIAVWGELASWSCKGRGLQGVVIDGTTRDVEDIVGMDFPVFARYTAPNAGEPKGFGELNCEITCGGQLVRDGDWVIGDDSGVVVVPKENALEIANRALDIKEWENRIREEIKGGKTLSVVMELQRWETVG